MKWLLRPRPRHRRDWRRFWRYCRCGFRWACPDSVGRVPMPYEPCVRPLTAAEYRAGMEASSPVPKVVRLDPIVPPAPAEFRARINQRHPLWNSPSGVHKIGRAGALTRGRLHRARHNERAGRV
ncbi:hypothetical protein [Plantactinospora soyae]|uniref:Uncharacterized protein n=1 Tax=Plantactinospora soyae TaxID=1544732 RepID=A0A927MBH3_9ACTN|nr:hypothetical protein [Plantactinospora soyae]MBE1488768.1 hypothetical protein [Plantactinospora soyae]